MTDASEVVRLTASHAAIRERMAGACERAGRDPDRVALVAVSKTVPAPRLRAALVAGIGTFGENRVQEALAKVPEVAGGRWHLVGALQSNKARRAVALFDVIESVDSPELARRIGAIATELGRAPYPVLLQVNVDRDPAKAGFDPEALAGMADELATVDGLRVDGLMTVGRLVAGPDEARSTFVALRELGDRLREAWPWLGRELSMGMSDDFEVAIEEGATIVRVGRALFGDRPHA